MSANGIYTFTASNDAIVDYPALVTSMNNYLWTPTDGSWVLDGNQVSWSDEPWQYVPDGLPSKIVESYRLVDDLDGDQILIDHQEMQRCTQLLDSDEHYFESEKWVHLTEQELVEEIGIHVKSGWIEIASVAANGIDHISFMKFQINANGFVRIHATDSGNMAQKKLFSADYSSQAQALMGGE